MTVIYTVVQSLFKAAILIDVLNLVSSTIVHLYLHITDLYHTI